MTREWTIIAGLLAPMLLLAAISEPVAVRLLRHPATLDGTWRIIALGANLAGVLALALLLTAGAYFVRRLATQTAEV